MIFGSIMTSILHFPTKKETTSKDQELLLSTDFSSEVAKLKEGQSVMWQVPN
jgi:hypothetical protein